MLHDHGAAGATAEILTAGNRDMQPLAAVTAGISVLLQLTYAFAHGGAIDPKLFRQRHFGRQLFARPQAPGEYLPLDRVVDHLVGGQHLQFPEALRHDSLFPKRCVKTVRPSLPLPRTSTTDKPARGTVYAPKRRFARTRDTPCRLVGLSDSLFIKTRQGWLVKAQAARA